MSLRYFLKRHIPRFHRVLLVESGSRYLLEDLLPGLYATHPESVRVDLVTCFAGLPEGFDASRGEVFRVYEYNGRARRRALYTKLRENGYNILGMICSGEPVMTKWKWALAWQVPAKVFILNENGDYFWFDRTNWRIIRHFVLFRAGLSGASAIPTVSRLLLFPFTLAYLLLYAAWVHLRRKVRQLA